MIKVPTQHEIGTLSRLAISEPTLRKQDAVLGGFPLFNRSLFLGSRQPLEPAESAENDLIEGDR